MASARTPPSPAAARVSPPETPQPSDTPPSRVASLKFVFPVDGEVVHDRQFNVIGNGPPGARITRDIALWFDEHATVQDDGTWLMAVSLEDGPNVLRFRIGDDRSTEQAITVTYQPRP